MTLKLVSEYDVLKVDKDDKRNTKKRFLITDGICLKCGCIVNYKWEKACVLCCGSREFLVGEPSKVLRDILELDIEQLRSICTVRCISGSGRTKLTLYLFRTIFPKLTRVDDRINEMFIRKIITRNRRRFWYTQDIEDTIYNIRRSERVRSKINIKFVDEKDMVKC